MLEPGTRLDTYEILRPLRSGGMGTVYLGKTAHGIEVAIKVLHPHLMESAHHRDLFMMEGELGCQIAHQGVVTARSYGSSEGRYYLAMKYVEGQSLDHALRGLSSQGRRLSEQTVVYIGIRIAEALDALHCKQVVHCDISPQNILVSDQGDLHLIDLGVAKHDADCRPSTHVMGKLAYFAPEIFAAAGPSRQSDIFALGAVLWEIITGRRLRGDSPPSGWFRGRLPIVQQPSSIGIQLHAGLEAIVMRSLATDPTDRYSSADDLARDLMTIWLGDEAGQRDQIAELATLRRTPRNSGIVPIRSASHSTRTSLTLRERILQSAMNCISSPAVHE